MAGVKEVAVKVAAEFDQTKAVSEDVVRFVLEAIKVLAAAESVIIKGFGTFSTKERAACTRRNPATGGTVAVPAKLKLCLKTKAVEK